MVAPLPWALVPALPLVFALLQRLTKIDPKKIHDRADGEARNPGGGNVSEPNVNESSHC